jgi:tetratricopeptide (TPR) repeat protein
LSFNAPVSPPGHLQAFGGVSPEGRMETLSPGGESWRPAPGSADLPHGNPLTEPLELSAAERALFVDAADGRLHRLSLLDAGLLACGVEDSSSINIAHEKVAMARDQLLQMVATTPPLSAAGERQSLERVRLIHQVLHQRLLFGGYDANATNLAATLRTGIYNCATATLLFVTLAGEVEVQAAAMELPGHVRAIVECGGQEYEVEVTCPVWSDAVRPVRTTNKMLGGENDAFSGSEIPRREISALGLVAMIYYNRGIDAFNGHRFSESLAANRRALLLDPENKIARGNLLAALNNWALQLCDEGYFAEAESLLSAGQQYDPQHLAFIHNAAHVQQVWEKMQAAVINH